MEKKNYESPESEIVFFDANDAICTSGEIAVGYKNSWIGGWDEFLGGGSN